jgi:hypothetical protein
MSTDGVDDDTSKRKRQSTGGSSTSERVDYKRACQLLSISSSESSGDTSLQEDIAESPGDTSLEEDMADEQKNTPGATVAAAISEMEDFMVVKMDAMKKDFLEFTNTTMRKMVEDLESRVETLETEVSDLKTAKVGLQKANANLFNMLTKCQDQIMDLEQHSRKSNVKVFGMAENASEDCKKAVAELVKEKLGVDLSASDIDAAHRVPTSRQGKPRPVIVRLFRREHREAILRSRKKLKKSGVSIHEDVGQSMRLVMNRLRDHEDYWVWNCKLFAKHTNGQIRQVRYGVTIEELFTD